MPKRKKDKPVDKPLIEMTSEELAEHVFGKELKEKLDQIAHEKDNKPDTDHSHK